MQGIVGPVSLLVGVALLACFYNTYRRVGQIRDDEHAIRLMLEQELMRAARERYSSASQPPAQPDFEAAKDARK
jgi:hypothetical protein